MRTLLYTMMLALTAGACSTARNLAYEDDIYYVPDGKAPAATSGRVVATSGTPATHSGTVSDTQTAALVEEAHRTLAAHETVNETIYVNSGYWIGGYKGNSSDLQEIQHIIDMYPNGFAFFNNNGYDIAMNLSFDPDWNVYTDNGRYWWFPSSSNIDFYSSLLFGTYPKYIWTVVWDNPRFDSWAFDIAFNDTFRFGIHWGRPGWSFGFGWGHGWYDPWCHGWYDPWYNPWYGHWHGYWYHPWYGHWNDPWHGHYYPGWGHPSRPSHPLAGQRPHYGGGVSGIRPGGRPGNTRPTGYRRPSTSGAVRPPMNTGNGGGYVRPNTGATNRPGYRPGNSGSNTSGQYRPGGNTRPTRPNVRPSGNTTTRPNTSGILRPGSNNRPNSTTTRPGTTTRPSNTSRPNNTTTRPGNTTTRPTRPTRNDREYTRPQSNQRPTYNRPGGSTYRPNRSTTPPRNSGSTYRPSRGNTGGGTYRPTRR